VLAFHFVQPTLRQVEVNVYLQPQAPMTTKDPVMKLVLEAISEMDMVSDRAVAVLGLALLDDALERLARQSMTTPKKEHFGGFGFLSTSADRTEALFQFGIIPAILHDDLNFLQGVRNEFAHGARPGITFDSTWVAGRVDKLTYVRTVLGQHKPHYQDSNVRQDAFYVVMLKKADASRRGHFIATVITLVSELESLRRESPMPVFLPWE